LESVETLVQAARQPLLIAHVAPDGDAVGSMLGLAWAFREKGRRPTLACADPVPESLRFLPGADEITAQAIGAEDAVIAIDCSDKQRLGTLYDESRLGHLPLVNIDHHVTNTRFGDAALVEPTAASTAQIVYGLLQRLAWPVSPWTATCLLAGIVSDTRSFRTANTDVETVRTALALMEAGAPLAEVNQHLEHDLTIGVITLWGRVLSGAQIREGVIWTEVSQETQHACGVSSDDNAGLVSFIASAREAKVAVLLTEKADGSVEVGLRSVPGVDVSAVALAFGGGGHRQAAGCTVPGPISVAREAVLKRVALALKPGTQPMPQPLAQGETDSS
jgi:phosphoesterase RecJ-like protein